MVQCGLLQLLDDMNAVLPEHVYILTAAARQLTMTLIVVDYCSRQAPVGQGFVPQIT